MTAVNIERILRGSSFLKDNLNWFDYSVDFAAINVKFLDCILPTFECFVNEYKKSKILKKAQHWSPLKFSNE